MFRPYKYVKKEYTEPAPRRIGFAVEERFRVRAISYKSSYLIKSFISAVLIFSGVLIMATKVLVPVVVIYANTENQAPVISPIPEQNSPDLTDETGEVFTFQELSRRFVNGVDYKKDSGILYPEFLEEKVAVREDVPEYFYISIPKLKIEDAKIKSNSDNLDPVDALGHYNGSCLPSESCNSFIYGHSSYSYSENHYKEGNYRTIFSKLGDLEYGDEFSIRYNGKTYKYIVEMSKVQKPENVDPLGDPLPRSLGKYTSTVELFTCTPPGTTKYRLSVIGKLVK